MVENATLEAVEALKKRDTELAQRVYNGDREINAKRFEIENECIITIATQQPIMASDLHLLASILWVTSEIVRIGDYAKGIANICLQTDSQPLAKPLTDIPHMAKNAVDMLHRGVDAFVTKDAKHASLIPLEDDKVHNLYKQVYRELVTIMFADSSSIDRANYLMWAAHNLERLADRVTNICERTTYIATGEMEEIDVSNDGVQYLRG
jgi:phosphate transport system protein